MRSSGWKFLIAVAVTFLFVLLLGYGCSGEPSVIIASVISAAIWSAAGIIIGTVIFHSLTRWIQPRWYVRMLSGILSGIAAVIIGWTLGNSVILHLWQKLVYTPHPEVDEGDLGSALFLYLSSALLTGLVGFAFGAGIGQSKLQDEH